MAPTARGTVLNGSSACAGAHGGLKQRPVFTAWCPHFVAAGLRPAVEGVRPAARKQPGSSKEFPASGPSLAGQDARLYGRPEARRYGVFSVSHSAAGKVAKVHCRTGGASPQAQLRGRSAAASGSDTGSRGTRRMKPLKTVSCSLRAPVHPVKTGFNEISYPLAGSPSRCRTSAQPLTSS